MVARSKASRSSIRSDDPANSGSSVSAPLRGSADLGFEHRFIAGRSGANRRTRSLWVWPSNSSKFSGSLHCL